MIDQDEIFSGDDVLLLPSLDGVNDLSDLRIFVQGLADYIEVDLPFEVSADSEFLFSEGDDTVLLDGAENKVALISGENVDVVQAEGDSTIFVTGTNIKVDLEAGNSTLFWDGGADNMLSLNVDGGSVRLVLPDRVLSPDSEVLLVDNAVYIDGFDTGIVFAEAINPEVLFEFVDLQGNSIAHNMPEENSASDAITVSGDTVAFVDEENSNFEIDDSFSDEWNISDLKIFDEIEKGPLEELDEISPSIDVSDLEKDIFLAEDVKLVDIKFPKSEDLGSDELKDLDDQAMIYGPDDKKDMKLAEAEIDWFLDASDFSDFTIDDPLSLIDEI